jgi:hypothetical protein
MTETWRDTGAIGAILARLARWWQEWHAGKEEIREKIISTKMAGKPEVRAPHEKNREKQMSRKVSRKGTGGSG